MKCFRGAGVFPQPPPFHTAGEASGLHPVFPSIKSEAFPSAATLTALHHTAKLIRLLRNGFRLPVVSDIEFME